MCEIVFHGFYDLVGMWDCICGHIAYCVMQLDASEDDDIKVIIFKKSSYKYTCFRIPGLYRV